MKKVFSSHSELAHVWAQNNQSEGRAGNMFFRDGMLYSYGDHFCIARILKSGAVVYGTHSYSLSTGKHQSLARSAASHRTMVCCSDPAASPWHNRDETEVRIKSELVVRKGTHEQTCLKDKVEAMRLANQFNEYLLALPAEEVNGCSMIDIRPLQVSAEDRARLRVLQDEAQAKREERGAMRDAMFKRLREIEALKQAEKIPLWRSGEYQGSMYNVPTMLRLSKDGKSVETSKGANIPVSFARRLWNYITDIRANGFPKGMEENYGAGQRLGHYTLNRIEADGSIVVGCHQIAYVEIEGIAKQLGLLPEVAA